MKKPAIHWVVCVILLGTLSCGTHSVQQSIPDSGAMETAGEQKKGLKKSDAKTGKGSAS